MSRMPLLLAAPAVAATLLLAACGDDSDDSAPDTTTAAAGTTAAPATTAAPDTTGAQVQEIQVTTIDYEYKGLPASVPAGTKFSLSNESAQELHEFVAFRLPDGEERSADELVQLPEEELGALFAGEPAAVLLAAPGSDETIPAVGDGTLSEPGHYVIFCAIPTGADPDAYLNAPPGDGPPSVPGGPPHFLQGMYADLIVE